MIAAECSHNNQSKFEQPDPPIQQVHAYRLACCVESVGRNRTDAGLTGSEGAAVERSHVPPPQSAPNCPQRAVGGRPAALRRGTARGEAAIVGRQLLSQKQLI